MPTSKTKEKMRAAHLGNVHSPETREKMRVAHQGKRHALGCRHTPEANEKKRKASLGNKNNAAKTVEVRGVTYKCMKDAATAIGMNTNTLYTRIRRYNKTNNWPDGWGYVT
jgi:transcriptional regulator of acetoin/glycerol metabolism